MTHIWNLRTECKAAGETGILLDDDGEDDTMELVSATGFALFGS